MPIAPTPETMPVIVGIGEITDRPAEPHLGLEPVRLMAVALRRADEDAGGGLLARLDSLAVVNQATWGYDDILRTLGETLGRAPAHAVYGPVGGESPIRFLHEAAARITAGESRVAAVCGAEAQHTLTHAQKLGLLPAWTPGVPFPPRKGGGSYSHPLAQNLGAMRPLAVYPLYENATAAAWGQTPREALAESGELWSRYAAVAATNPHAWLGKPYTAEEIVTPSASNRRIAWPYTKLMVANPNVNQAAAIFLTSLAEARSMGIAEERLIFVWGGAAASEPRDFVQRGRYDRSHAQEAVLREAQRIAEREAASLDVIELYSCCPVVPKMTRRILDLPRDAVPTTTGGLTFFGAPLNDYMAHATCGMVRHLRGLAGGRDHTGLLYGQGGFVTTHHALVVGTRPPSAPVTAADEAVQAEVERRREPVPPLREGVFGGAAVLETHTVLYDREGHPEHGIAVLRLGDGARTLARVRGDEAIAALTDLERSPIGTTGELGDGGDGIAVWRPVA